MQPLADDRFRPIADISVPRHHRAARSFLEGLAVLVLFLSVALVVDQTSSAVTPKMVERMIDRDGARQAVNKLANAAPDDTRTLFGDYDKVLEGVASGDARWLALVPKLRPGTDAGTAEALHISVAEALPKNPAGVLRLIMRLPSWQDVCSYPMIEPTDEEMRAYFNAAIPAVKAVRDPALQHSKHVCLADLVKAQLTP